MKTLYILLFSIILFIYATPAQTDVAKAEAMFIYNFARLIQWPPDYANGNFIVGILGTSEVESELTSFAVGKKVGFQDIEVKRFKTPEEITKCHIIFIPFTKSSLITTVAEKTSGFKTLIIGEKKGTIESGAAINFLITGEKLQFELSADNAVKNGLKVSAKLKEMAAANY